MTEAPDLVKRCYRLVVKLQHGPFLKLSKEFDMRVLTSISVIVACSWTAFVPVVLAQDERNENWFRVDIIQVIPDRLNDFIDLQVDDLIPAYKRAGVPFRSVWQTAEFGNTYERVFATPIASMADFDRGGPLAVALDPDRLARIAEEFRRYLESADVGGRALAHLTTVEITPGRGGEWEAFFRQNLEQFRRAGVVFGMYQFVYGPGPAKWQIVQNHRSFDELNDPGIITQAFGSDASSVLSNISGLVMSVERTVLRYDPELSFSAEAP